MIYSSFWSECQKCENGYFNKNINEPCRKWTEYVLCVPFFLTHSTLHGYQSFAALFMYLFHPRCKYGVKTNGNTTSDVVCNPEILTPNTACSTSNCRHEGIQIQDGDTTTITTTTITSSSSSTTTAAPPGHTLTTKRVLQPPMPSNTGTYTGKTYLYKYIFMVQFQSDMIYSELHFILMLCRTCPRPVWNWCADHSDCCDLQTTHRSMREEPIITM